MSKRYNRILITETPDKYWFTHGKSGCYVLFSLGWIILFSNSRTIYQGSMPEMRKKQTVSIPNCVERYAMKHHPLVFLGNSTSKMFISVLNLPPLPPPSLTPSPFTLPLSPTYENFNTGIFGQRCFIVSSTLS